MKLNKIMRWKEEEQRNVADVQLNINSQIILYQLRKVSCSSKVQAKGSSAYGKSRRTLFWVTVSGHVFGVKSIPYPLGSEISVSGAFKTFTRLILPCSKHPCRSSLREKGRGKTSTKILKAQEMTVLEQWKEWLGTIPDGKLPTNQKTEG